MPQRGGGFLGFGYSYKSTVAEIKKAKLQGFTQGRIDSDEMHVAALMCMLHGMALFANDYYAFMDTSTKAANSDFVKGAKFAVVDRGDVLYSQAGSVYTLQHASIRAYMVAFVDAANAIAFNNEAIERQSAYEDAKDAERDAVVDVQIAAEDLGNDGINALSDMLGGGVMDMLKDPEKYADVHKYFYDNIKAAEVIHTDKPPIDAEFAASLFFVFNAWSLTHTEYASYRRATNFVEMQPIYESFAASNFRCVVLTRGVVVARTEDKHEPLLKKSLLPFTLPTVRQPSHIVPLAVARWKGLEWINTLSTPPPAPR